ncbi:MAG: hypothetical protein MUF31_02355 [Akkermansiaceae bacterium]|jgi:magnesium-transporting ATPase (P-type)|nr:hypothetical protein [Akkermansiaceae bacterium]
MNLWRKNLGAAVLLGMALIAFGVFHGAPVVWQSNGGDEWEAVRGNTVWESLIDSIKDPDDFEIEEGIVFGSLFLAVAVILSSPFLVSFLVRSRWMWWVYLVSSILILLGITGMFIFLAVTDSMDDELQKWGWGFGLWLAFPALHFLGMLSLKRQFGGMKQQEDID